MKILLALGLAAAVSLPCLRGQEPADPLPGEFQLFVNAHADIVDYCVYRPTKRQVVVEALRELRNALGPSFAPFFPPEREIPAEVGGTFVAYKHTIQRLAESEPGLRGGWTTLRLVEKSLDAYCRSLDGYSEYTDAGTAKRAAALKNPDYVGIGVTIRRDAKGRYFCTPFAGGAADRAGLVAGDELLAIEEKDTRPMTLLDIGSRLEGKPESTVRVKVKPAGGATEEIVVKRERISSTPLTKFATADGVRIAMRRIDDRAAEDLRVVLRSLGSDRVVRLDLRGCEGGDFKAALRIAELFLPEHTVTAVLETPRGKEKCVSGNRTPYRPRRLIILQDDVTASGAEMIITALLAYKPLNAESRGTRTFGKGVTTQLIKIAGGGVLNITDSRMYGPNNETWDGEGRLPTSDAPVDAP